MEETEKRYRADPDRPGPGLDTCEGSTQTDSRAQGHGPRLSKVNLFTLLSLWMELYPQDEDEEDEQSQVHRLGLVVVQDGKVVGLHCSGPDLHAGQSAILQHGRRLAGCQLFCSRRPCVTCLKMIINAGVSQISFWPGDPEISMLRSSSAHSHNAPGHISEEAALDAVASEKLKSNSRPHMCVLLQPLAPGMAQFITETSRENDFMERGRDTHTLYHRERLSHLKRLSRLFLVEAWQQHTHVLTHMGLENLSVEPYFSCLRNNMRELVEVLCAAAAGVPTTHHGFYRETSSPPPLQDHLSQEEARHCMVQARLLAYRTEDHKVGVGAVIWAQRRAAGSHGTGRLYFVGCGYNAYPAGSQYAEYPQMDNKQEDRQRRKYRYIIHAEQNALTFRTREVRADEHAVLFVTKCPCDECVPLIRAAGITHIYTTDQDRDKDKGDISYLRFSSLKDVSRFIWRRSPSVDCSPSPRLVNGHVGKHSRGAEPESCSSKKLCTDRDRALLDDGHGHA